MRVGETKKVQLILGSYLSPCYLLEQASITSFIKNLCTVYLVVSSSIPESCVELWFHLYLHKPLCEQIRKHNWNCQLTEPSLVTFLFIMRISESQICNFSHLPTRTGTSNKSNISQSLGSANLLSDWTRFELNVLSCVYISGKIMMETTNVENVTGN